MLNLTNVSKLKTRSDQPQFGKTIYLIKSKSYPSRYMAKLWYAENFLESFMKYNVSPTLRDIWLNFDMLKNYKIVLWNTRFD